MLIRDYREITNKAENEIKNKALQKCMEEFDKFHLNEQSRTILESYFRFLSRRKETKRDLAYNFILYCNDISLIQEFAQSIAVVERLITNEPSRSFCLSEKQFLDKPGEAFNMLENSQVFALYDFMPNELFSPDSRTGRMEEKKRAWDETWDDFIARCEQNKSICKILAAPESVIKDRFRNNEHLFFRIFRHHINVPDMSVNDAYKEVLSDLKESNVKCSSEFEEALEKYILTVYPKADLKNKLFVDDLIERLLTKFYSDSNEAEELLPRHVPTYKSDRDYAEIIQDLNKLVGLKKVKESLLELPYLLQESSTELTPALHMAFIGNPGTGKTTVAQLSADLLYSIGVIKKNKVVTVSALDLIGQYVGETPRITKRYCQKAYGGILFIDEAYLIASSGNESNNDQIKKECIGTLLQEMENNRDNLLVIFAGYSKEMESFLYKSNSGLGSRLYKILEFDDYSDDELMEIFFKMCEKEHFTVTKEAEEKVKLKLTTLRYSRDFGNARTVRNVFLEAKKEYRRTKNNDKKEFNAQHIILETGLRDFGTVKGELDSLIGLQSVKDEIVRTIETYRFSNLIGQQIPLSKHMLFLGNAGTGKSTVANLFCQMLFSIGATKSPNCNAITASDILGRNNPIDTLKEQCTRASGGVLFIDEAYVLQSDPRCSSCISVLLDVMERERDNIIIILAGYEAEMKAFLSKNQGLESRFPVTLKFDDYSIEEMTRIFILMCNKYNFTVSDKGLEKFEKIINIEKESKHFGNARTVRNIFEQSFRAHAEHFMNTPDDNMKLCLDDRDITTMSMNETLVSKRTIGFAEK